MVGISYTGFGIFLAVNAFGPLREWPAPLAVVFLAVGVIAGVGAFRTYMRGEEAEEQDLLEGRR